MINDSFQNKKSKHLQEVYENYSTEKTEETHTHPIWKLLKECQKVNSRYIGIISDPTSQN